MTPLDLENYLHEHIPLSAAMRVCVVDVSAEQVVLACMVGELSLKATYFLMYHGYTQVANMEGGIVKWARRGFPIKGTRSSAASTAVDATCCGPTAADGGCC